MSCCGNSVLGGDDPNADMGTEQPKTLAWLTVSPDNDVMQVDVTRPRRRRSRSLRTTAMVPRHVSASSTLSLENTAVGSLAGLTFTSAQSATARLTLPK